MATGCGGGAERLRFRLLWGEAVCARLRRRSGNCTATARSRCVWSSVVSSAYPLCTSHPSLLLLPAPPPLLLSASPVRIYVCVSSLDEVTHPRREVIWRLPW